MGKAVALEKGAMQPDNVEEEAIEPSKPDEPPAAGQGTLPKRIQKAAEEGGLPDASTDKSTPIHAPHLRASEETDSEKGFNPQGTAAHVMLAQMAKELRKGGELQIKDGRLFVRSGANGRAVATSPKSVEHARLFLLFLVENAHGKDQKVRQSVQKAFKDLIASHWLISVLKKNPELGRNLEFSAAEIFGSRLEKEHKAFLEWLQAIQAAGASPSPSARSPSPTLSPSKLQNLEAKKTLIRTGLTKSGASIEVSKKIALLWADQWKGCFVEQEDPSAVLLEQDRGPNRIKGLKIGGAAGHRYADYTIRSLAEGGMKRVKLLAHISADGSVTKLVRFAKKSAELKESFFGDAQREISVRQALLDEGEKQTFDEEMQNGRMDDYIAIWEAGPSHIGGASEVKTRYLAEHARGDLSDFMSDPKVLRPEILRVLLNVVRGLRFMHVRGYVHSDLKPENVLVFKSGKGKLADLGGSNPAGEPVAISTVGYRAPELASSEEASLHPLQDMFSFGIMLLLSLKESASAPWEKELATILLEADDERYKDSKNSEAAKVHRSLIEECQKLLRDKAGKNPYGSLYRLIADLISYEPDDRPDSTETERRLSEVVASLPK